MNEFHTAFGFTIMNNILLYINTEKYLQILKTKEIKYTLAGRVTAWVRNEKYSVFVYN